MIGGRFRAGVMVVALLLLAGCSDDGEEPTPLPSGTPSTLVTSAPEVTEEPPVAPEALRSAAGAEAFVRYFWEVYNYSYVSLNTDSLTGISQRDCEFCASAASEINAFSTVSTKKEGGTISVEAVSAPPVEAPERIVVVAILNQSAGQTVTSTGATTTISAIKRARASIGLQWHQDAWHVHGVDIETT